MRFDEFFGGSYEHQAFTADQQRTVNWYPEKVQSTGRGAMLPTPGVSLLYSADDDSNSALYGGPGRAHFSESGLELAVIGTGLWRLKESAIEFLAGLGGSIADPATISSNGDAGGQILVTSGGNATYHEAADNYAAHTISALTGKAHFGAFLDGYLVALDTSTSTLYWSDLNDGTTWQTTVNFANRNLGSDRWLSMRIMERGIWLFGEHTTEVWYNTGNSRQPFAPNASGVIEFGILSPWSVEVLGNNIFWLGKSRNGRVCVLRGHGFEPTVISTYALDNQIAQYKGRTTAVADAYSEAGHSFYVLNFDADNISHAWDSETGLWHDRGSWDADSKRYTSWRPRFYGFAFGQHRMLDTSNGNVYRCSQSLPRDVGGKVIRRMRRAPAINEENTDLMYSEFELELEPGNVEPDCHVGFHMETITLGEITGEPADTEQDIDFTVPVSGGSGDYDYEWAIYDNEEGEGDPLETGTDATFRVSDTILCACTGCGVYVIVTDQQTGALATRNRSTNEIDDGGLCP